MENEEKKESIEQNTETTTNVEIPQTNDMLVQDKTSEKKSNNMLIYIAIAIVSLLIGAIPAFIIGKSYAEKTEPVENNNSNEEKEENDNEEIPVEKEEEEKEFVPVEDQFTFVNFGNQPVLYMIDNNKDVYYFSGKNNFMVTYDYCIDNPEAPYCNNKDVFFQDFIKIEGVSNVKKIKLYHNPYSTGESFSTFAITYDGVVYLLEQSNATEYVLFKGLKIKDFTINENQDIYTVTLVDGTTKTIEQPHPSEMYR